jgi:acyl-CoA synthetase (NDP forming)
VILLQFGPMALRGMEVAEAVCDFRKRCAKTVCVAWALAPSGVPERLRNEGLYVFTEPARAIATLGKLVQRHADASASTDNNVPAALDFDWSAHVQSARAGTVISEHECHRLLAAAGLAVAAGRLARSESEALEAAQAVKLPVAMKAISPALTHRAAAGLVALGLRSGDEVRDAFRRLCVTAERAGIALDGIYVQHMVDADLEVLVSAFRDPVFGVIVSCGTGGNLVELIDDVTLERAPFAEQRALAMIERLRLARMAKRLQGAPDPQPLAAFIARFSQLAAGAPWRRFVLEVNPLKWRRETVTAVDGLLIVEEP